MKRLFIYSILILFALLYLSPLYVMLVNSFKPLWEIQEGSILALPEFGSFDPWIAAWQEAHIGLDHHGLQSFFYNSALITLPTVVIIAFLGALNGYVLTKWRFKGDRLIYMLLLFSAFIPFQIILIPLAKILGLLNLSGTLAGLVLAYVVYGLGLSTVFFYGFYRNFPQSLVSAAQLDGAGFFAIFRRILLPNSLPMFALVAIWFFTQTWNEYLLGATFSSADSRPVSVGLLNLVGDSHGVRHYNIYFAGTVLVSIPPLLIYLFLGRYFQRAMLGSYGVDEKTP